MAKERTSISIGGVFKLTILRQGTILAGTKSLLPGCARIAISGRRSYRVPGNKKR